MRSKLADDYEMLSSNRLAAVLSTLWLSVGCVDPQGRLDDFASRTKTGDGGAGASDAAPGNIYDVSGTFLIGIRIYFAPAKPVQLLATQTLTMNADGTAKMDFHIRLLDKNTRTPTGDPLDILNVPVSKSGDLTIPKDVMVIPAAANPVGIDATVQNVMLLGTLKSAAFLCGTVKGHIVEANQNLEDGEPSNPTTWAGIRVQPGQTGNDLPATVSSCAGAPAAADAGT